MPNSLPMTFAEIIMGGLLIDKGMKMASGAFSGSAGASTGQGQSVPAPATGKTLTGLTGATAALAAAQAASAARIPYSSSVQSSGLLAGFRSDCSGFASWVLSHASPAFAQDPTTVDIPSTAGVAPGAGQYITIWNRALPGDAGHVILDIMGSWFESGGQQSGGPHQMTAAAAQSEISGGLQPFHILGL